MSSTGLEKSQSLCCATHKISSDTEQRAFVTERGLIFTCIPLRYLSLGMKELELDGQQIEPKFDVTNLDMIIYP